MSRPTVLVTGAGRGIGRATVQAFSAAGWMAIAGVRDVDRARAEYPSHPDAAIVHLDVTDAASIASGVGMAHDIAGGPLACLVNNAGYAVIGAAEDVDLDAVRAMFETNLFGAVAVTQAVLPAMREARAGMIANVSSIGAQITNPLLGMYHGSKYAMAAWSEALRIELAPFGVRVAMLEPGMVDTDFPLATTATGALATGEGPYAELFTRLRSGFRAWRERNPTPAADVAAAIIGAVTDPHAPFRVPVGDDAVAMASARKRLGDEDFHAWLADYLGVEWQPTP
jgi:NAD(P)-dependent dehydrogenase (short-subunit alcohol dehydrogenase family)